jgi:hypothetical protein
MPTKGSSTAFRRADLQGAVMGGPDTFQGIASRILTPIAVPAKTGVIRKIAVENLLNTSSTGKRSSKTGYARVEHDLTDDTYSCDEFGKEFLYDDADRANYASEYDYEVAGTQLLINEVLRDQEVRVASLIQNITTFPLSGNTGADVSGSTPWSTTASSTPVNDVINAVAGIKARCGMVDLSLQITHKQWQWLSLSAQIRGGIQYTTGAQNFLGLDTLALQLGVRDIVVAMDTKNTAAGGATASLSSIWSDTYAFFFVRANSSNIRAPGLGRIFFNTSDGGLGTTEQYREEGVRSDVYRFRQNVQEKLLYSQMGYLLKVS